MSSSSTNKQTATTNPAAFQQGYLDKAFGQASTLMDSTAANTYTGPQVAQFSPDARAGFSSAVGRAFNSGAPDATMAAGGALLNNGVAGTNRAVTSLENFSPTGGADSNIADATKYADSRYVSGAVDAAMRDANRQVSEQVLPQIARDAAQTGNTFSNRRAISEAITQRGLADRTADVSSQMRQAMYSEGLDRAEQGRQFDNQARQGAIATAGNLSQGQTSAGLGAMSGAVDQIGGLTQAGIAAANAQQTAGQAEIDNNKAQKEAQQNALWDALQKYYGIVGSQNWGSTQSGETTSNPSVWNVIGGLMSAGGNLARGVRGLG